MTGKEIFLLVTHHPPLFFIFGRKPRLLDNVFALETERAVFYAKRTQAICRCELQADLIFEAGKFCEGVRRVGFLVEPCADGFVSHLRSIA